MRLPFRHPRVKMKECAGQDSNLHVIQLRFNCEVELVSRDSLMPRETKSELFEQVTEDSLADLLLCGFLRVSLFARELHRLRQLLNALQ